MVDVVKEIEKEVEQVLPKKKNDWKILSGVLVLIIIGLLIYIFFFSKSSGGVSGNQAGEELVKFLNGRTGGGVEFVSAQDKGSLYQVTVSYQGQDVPVYVTKDAKFFVQAAVPMTGELPVVNNTEEESAPPQEVPKSDKPTVELYVMSYCPFGTQAEKGIIPAIEALNGKVDFKLKFVSYAMHEKQEIDENTKQYCIQKEQSSKLLPYLKCFLKEGKSDACLTETKVDTTKMNACIAAADKQFNITGNYNNKGSWLNGRFPKYDVDAADNIKYGVGGSPTLIINGAQSNAGRDSASYLKAICNSFNTAPSECSQQLSSTQPSSGFGYGTASANSGATCG